MYGVYNFYEHKSKRHVKCSLPIYGFFSLQKKSKAKRKQTQIIFAEKPNSRSFKLN